MNKLEAFKCDRLRVVLTRGACAKMNVQHKHYGNHAGCADCPIGIEHAKGTAAEVQLVVLSLAKQDKPYVPRTCIRCGGALGKRRWVCSAACASEDAGTVRINSDLIERI